MCSLMFVNSIILGMVNLCYHLQERMTFIDCLLRGDITTDTIEIQRSINDNYRTLSLKIRKPKENESKFLSHINFQG